MLSHLKRRVGVLSAVAVMAAFLPVLTASVASAIPATALSPKAVDDGATYSACPTGSAAAAGFTDTTSTDVDCIAMHGITTGVTATTYEPSANVPRWQMALYLTRMATSAGVTLGSGADQGFTDISGYSAAIQTAINQIKQLGVTVGKTATTYAPDDNVTREEMALFLDRALATMVAGPGGISAASGNSLLGLNVNSDSTGTGEYNYDDIDGGSVTFEGHNSIVEIYQLGITGDLSTVRAFNPSSAITRATMATWLANALAHTNARPAGLWIQASTDADGFANNAPTLHVSHRDSSRNPVSGTVVDMFEWTNAATLADNAAMTAAGACASAVRITGNSLTKCKVEVGDPTTNTLGNLSDVSVTVTDATTETFFAWTAAAGTTFANATHGSGDNYSTVNASSATTSAVLLMSTNANAAAAVGTTPFPTTVAYGTSITLTAQMSAAKVGAAWAPVAQAGNVVTFVHTIEAVAADTVESVTTTKVTTDASGTATYTFTDADPTAASADGDTTHSIVVSDADGTTVLTSAAAAGYPNHFKTTGSTVEYDFTDDAVALTTSAMTTNLVSYAAGSALLPVARSATMSLLDQYGNAHTASSGDTVTFTGRAIGRISGWAANEQATFTAAHGLDVGDKVVITETPASPGAEGNGGSEDCTHTVLARTSDVIATFTLTTGDLGVVAGGDCVAGITALTGDADNAADGTWTFAEVHDTFEWADRTVGPDGTANIAWNDVTTTSGYSEVGGHAGDTIAATAHKTSYRYVAPDAVDVEAGNTTTVWTTNALNDLVDADGDVGAQIISWDDANNTLLVRLDATGVTCSLFALLADIGCAYTVTQYSYDDNDQFNLTADATAAATSLAGFELALTGHSNAADGVGGAVGGFARGDLHAVTYQALAGNVSIFSLGS